MTTEKLKNKIVQDLLKLENAYIQERNTERLAEIRRAIDLVDR